MTRTEVFETMMEVGIIPVVRAPSDEAALSAVEAVMKGGVSVVEITFTVPNAVEVIRTVAGRIGPDVILGAGTVTDAKKANDAIEAGARFIVAPNTDAETIRVSRELGAVVIPGAFTPTEVVDAMNYGADAVKIFPSSVGGPDYIKALRGPLPKVKYVPTGGIDIDNIPAYVKAGAAMFGVGGTLVNKDLVAAGDWDAITARAVKFVEVVKKAREDNA
jgi:2-dehydro-3-deoxyphosphogluconate aldolase / (4S)-4-hydroxy-2-oxoglutarate aldolase